MVRSASLGGSLHPNEREDDIRTGGSFLTVTLAGDAFWNASGSDFNAERQNFIDNLISNKSTADEPLGWNAIVKPGLDVTAFARHSDRLAILTLPAFSTYDIGNSEVISVTVPAGAYTDEKQIHPGSDAGSTISFHTFANGDTGQSCDQVTQLLTEAGQTSTDTNTFANGDSSFSCTAVGVLGAISQQTSTFFHTFDPTPGIATSFVTSTA